MTINESSFLMAWENRRLVAGALKAAHVRADSDNYEDLMQEGVCVYAQMLTQYSHLPRKQLDRLAFKRIIWRTIDLLRREQFLSEHTAESPQELAQNETELDLVLAIKSEVAKLPVLEQRIFYEHLLGRKALGKLAQEVGLHYSTMCKYKSRLLAYLRQQLA